MSANGDRGQGGEGNAAPEQRAEELMERLAGEGSRRLTRFLGRAREEVEDIIAEARTVHEQWKGGSKREG